MLTAPGLCWLCRMPLALPRSGICSVCQRTIRLPDRVCPRCGLPAASATLPCGRCLQKPPPWQRLVAVSAYAPPLSALIHQLKFSRRPELAAALARLQLLAILDARRTTRLALPDRIVSVPLYSRRQWLRGFNQSELLSRPLARWLSCRYASHTLTRVRPALTQHFLSARQRKSTI